MRKFLFTFWLIFSSALGSAQFCFPVYTHFSVPQGSVNIVQLTGFAASFINDTLPTAVMDTGYTDHTVTVDTIIFRQGDSYSVLLSFFSPCRHTGNQIWIDFNDDGVFDTASEMVCGVFPSPSYVDSVVDSVQTYVTIPATAIIGFHRMRIRNVVYNDTFYSHVSSSLDPCQATDLSNAYLNGVTADYTVKIVYAFCDSLAGFMASGITSSGALVSWDTVSGSSGYEYQVDLSPTPPASGSSTTGSAVFMSGLYPATTYYAHVRNNCGMGNYSTWETISFTTNCDTVAGLGILAITSTTAMVVWDSLAGSTSFEWAVDTSVIPPVSGTALADTFSPATGLTPGTTYYAHVRNNCGSSFSSWVTIPFATNCDTISSIHITGITDTSAIISWDSVAGSSVYQYAIDTSILPPGTGTVISDTIVSVNGLTPGTTYYVHVRNQCGGAYTHWATAGFSASHCDTVTGLTAVAGITGVSISWTAVTGSLDYYYQVDGLPTPPAGTGIITAAVNDTVTGLTPDSTYFIHVRTGCGGGYSGWVTIMAHTHACDTISGITISGISDTGALIYWPATAGASGYLYIVDTSSAVPSATGTLTDTAFILLNDLTPGMIYYVHLRLYCGGADSSAWVVVPFTTMPCDTVSGLTYTANDTGVTISWSASPGAAGYQLLVDMSPFSPSAGAEVMGLSATFSSLLPGLTYYIHIRVVCGGGQYSAWITVPFSTPLSVPGIGNNYRIQIFPNPVKDMLTLRCEGCTGDDGLLLIYDQVGRVVKKINVHNGECEADISGLVNAVYILKYEGGLKPEWLRLIKE